LEKERGEDTDRFMDNWMERGGEKKGDKLRFGEKGA
jgi:hypothetical protein